MTLTRPTCSPNDPRLAGQTASPAVRFGINDRYSAVAVHTRFSAVAWFVFDHETKDNDNLATVIRQEPTFEDAVAGFCLDCQEFVDFDFWSLSPKRCDACEIG